MEGNKKVRIPGTSACSTLREQAARITLQNVRSQGHPYVELRDNGKRFIFFCIICRAQCSSDTTLFDHLKGKLHKERYSGAKITLLGPNPWPFNDGMVFFNDDSSQQDKVVDVSSSNQNQFLNVINNNSEKTYQGDCEPFSNVQGKNLNVGIEKRNLVIPGVLLKYKISVLEAKFMGYGEIAARIFDGNENSSMIGRMWCCWLGREFSNNSYKLRILSDYDFAVITFSYNYDLGVKSVRDDFSSMLHPSSLHAVTENVESSSRKKRKTSFSDLEDICESMHAQCDLSVEDSTASSSSSRLLFDQHDDRFQNAEFPSSKTAKRKIKEQERATAERVCVICKQKMLPRKDVATLLNMKTGRLACSSTNPNGLSDLKIKSGIGKKKRRGRAKCSDKQLEDGRRVARTKSCSLFCPECMGIGLNIEGDQFQRQSDSLDKIFRRVINLHKAHKAWMKNPEILEGCSIGLNFSCNSPETDQERVSISNLLPFYRANQ